MACNSRQVKATTKIPRENFIFQHVFETVFFKHVLATFYQFLAINLQKRCVSWGSSKQTSILHLTF